MNGRRAFLFVTVAAALLVAIALLLDLGNGDSGTNDEPLLAGLASLAPDLDTITVTGAGNDVAATLRRTGEGWSVSERSGYPADTGRLRTLVRGLADARRLERKTAKPELYARLGVEPVSDAEAGGSQVALVAGDEVLSVIIGNPAPGGHRYARLPDEVESWLIDADVEAPADTTDWLDTALVDVPSADVQAITIQTAGGDTIELERPDDGSGDLAVSNLPEGRELQYPTVTSGITGALADLTLDDVRQRPHDVDSAPSTSSRYRLANGTEVRVDAYVEGDERWFEFAASGTDDAGDDEASSLPTPAELNARFEGWQYTLPSYKADALTSQWEDLLASEKPAE